MSIIWESRSEPFYTDDESEDISFHVHNEWMRSFRRAHPKVGALDSKCRKTADWLTLVPIQKVKLEVFSQN